MSIFMIVGGIIGAIIGGVSGMCSGNKFEKHKDELAKILKETKEGLPDQTETDD